MEDDKCMQELSDHVGGATLIHTHIQHFRFSFFSRRQRRLIFSMYQPVFYCCFFSADIDFATRSRNFILCRSVMFLLFLSCALYYSLEKSRCQRRTRPALSLEFLYVSLFIFVVIEPSAGGHGDQVLFNFYAHIYASVSHTSSK